MGFVMEIWKDVVGWEGYYQVSNKGNVRSLERMSRVNPKSTGLRKMGGRERVLTPRNGYLYVQLTANGRAKVYQVHYLVLTSFSGERKDKQVCRHLNGNPSDNRIENLAWGTHKENMEDRKKHGNYACGEKNINAKLTNEQALYIYNSDELGIDLAKKFNIYPTKISNIRRGITYVSVTGGVPKTDKRFRSKKP